jgi:DNA repair photolyase
MKRVSLNRGSVSEPATNPSAAPTSTSRTATRSTTPTASAASTLAPVKADVRMAGKPVVEVDSKTVINFTSGFSHKLLCDGLTFTAGSACVYSCAFCYVEGLMRKNPHQLPNPENHQNMVIRRRDAVEIAKRQLTYRDGSPRFPDPNDRRVIYASPLVDVAANLELARETVAICREILTRTAWQIRLLSKSSLLPRIASALEEFRDRVIYGVSTGTLDDRLGASFEKGTALVSKRIQSLRQLQDEGFRTYAMVCPSLPLADDAAYRVFAEQAAEELRTEQCEHVWAEVLNVRGQSMVRTCEALRQAGYAEHAERLERVSTDREAWEAYARSTFEAHARCYEGEPGKLRFMQYVGRGTRPYWEAQVARGAVLL